MNMSESVRQAFDENEEPNNRFRKVLLDNVQKAILIRLVEIINKIPRSKRQKCVINYSEKGDSVICPNQERIDAYHGDVEALGREGLIAFTNDPRTFDITPLGFAYHKYLTETDQIHQIIFDAQVSLNNSNHTSQQRNHSSKESAKDSKKSASEYRRSSIAGYGISDQATDSDQLGFEPYVSAVAEFLTHNDTKPPLTMSIEGEWGSGKSSFMLQLSNKLIDKGALTINFSPWQHDNGDSLWAAFAVSFSDQLQQSTNWLCRIVINVKLALSRFDWRQGWPEALRVAVKWVIFILLFICLFTVTSHVNRLFSNDSSMVNEKFSQKLTIVLGAIILIWKLLGEVKDIVGNPLVHELNKYSRKVDYGSKVCFVEKFHKDISKVARSYAKKKRVYVFIDDLDRCEVPKAAELIKAINMMISDDPALFFILGMDRVKVAAGLAVKDEAIIPYVAAQSKRYQFAENEHKSMSGLLYGSDYIEKFIQVPFYIPRAVPAKLMQMLNPDKSSSNPTIMTNKQTKVRLFKKKADGGGIMVLNENENTNSNVGLFLGKDSRQIESIVKMVSNALDCNPRRLKQFLNLFRLRACIAYETGILIYPGRSDNGGLVTLEQLGKITAIAVQWPLFWKAAQENKDIVYSITCVAEERQGALDLTAIKHWVSNKALIDLVKVNCNDDHYSMRNLEIEKISQILPKMTSIAPLQEYSQMELDFDNMALDRIENKEYTIKKQDSAVLEETAKLDLSASINSNTLGAYTKWKYPNLGISQEWQNRLLKDIDLTRFMCLNDIDVVVEQARPAVEAYAKENPAWFGTGTDYITKSLGFVDADFQSRHGWGDKTKAAFEKFRHLIKKT